MSVKRKEGKEYCLAALSKVIQQFCKFVPNNLTADDIVNYAEMMMNNYGYERFEDIVMIFRDALNGKYGKLYGEFTYAAFAEWMNKHLEGKSAFLENEHLDRKQHNLVGDSGRMSDEKDRDGIVGLGEVAKQAESQLVPKQEAEKKAKETYNKAVKGE